MSNTIKDKLANAGRTLAADAQVVTHKIAEGTEKVARFVKEKTATPSTASREIGLAAVKEQMNVFASCGSKVGVVDGVEGASIKLTRKESPDGQHHFIPAEWVERVDNAVHLKKNSIETWQEWKADSACCGCT